MLNKQKNTDESGVVSLLVVSVLAVVLALVSIGFSHLMDRELRQAEDRELSAQAYYAAEAGLNDARNYLQNSNTSFAGCATPASAGEFVSGGDLSNGGGAAKYSCVSVNTTPNQLVYALQAGQSVTFKVSLATMASMYFGWENQSYPNGPQPLGSLGTLPREDQVNPNSTGVLRVGIYPIPTSLPGGVTNTNDYLSYLSRSYFMYPNSGDGTAGSVSYSNNGSFVPGNCNVSRPIPINNPSATPRYCNSVLTGLSGSSNTYYVRLTAEYAPLNVSIQATNGGNSNPLSFSNVQGIVDVTGAGTDVLQRIQARIDLSNEYEAPSFGLQSMVAICKGFRVYVPDLGQYGNVMPPDQSFNNSDGACAQPNGGGSISGGGTGPLSSRSCPSPYSGTRPNCNLPAPPPQTYATFNTCNDSSTPCDSINYNQTVTVTQGQGSFRNPYGTVTLTNLVYHNGTFAVTLTDDRGICENFYHNSPSLGEHINGGVDKVYHNRIVSLAGNGPYGSCSNQT
ncbi:MAG TPA: hypothetical protein VHD84_02515 [Candidatus Saccharimonadales bacterium]|nr:hypothetical protein [Candidatus Saccharimonadales bacterium]